MKNSLLRCLSLAGCFATQLLAAENALTLKVEPERDLLLRGEKRELIVQIELEGRKENTISKRQRAPMNVSLVLDRSGSMAGAKIEKAKQAACVALDQIGSEDLVSVIVYDDKADVIIPAQHVDSTEQRENLKRRINRVRPGGGTAIYSGVQFGAEQLRKNLNREMVNRVILMSDGIANVGPSRTSDLAELGRNLRQDGMSVSTIGLGEDYNEDLMAALAEASSANYYYVKDAERLPGIFAEELGSVRSIVARSVTIKIHAPEGVKIREIIGHPEIVCRDQTVEIQLPEVFGSMRRRFLARCEVNAGAGESKEIAAVEMQFEDSDGDKAAVQNQNAVVKLTDAPVRSEESRRATVVGNALAAGNSEAKAEAVYLMEQGRPAEAAKVLRRQLAVAADLPAGLKPASAPLVDDLKTLGGAIESLEKRGRLDNDTTKQLKWETFKEKNASR